MEPKPDLPVTPPDSPSQPVNTGDGALIANTLNLLYALLVIPFSNAPLVETANLLVTIVALLGTPEEQLTPDSLTTVLRQLDATLACRNGNDCESVCALLANDCRVCATDEDCLDAIVRVCGREATRACRPDRERGRGRGRDD